MGPPEFEEPRYRASFQEHSSSRTLGAGSNHRRSVEPVDLDYLEDMVRRLVGENNSRINDDWGAYASRNPFIEDILHAKYPQRFNMPMIPLYGRTTDLGNTKI